MFFENKQNHKEINSRAERQFYSFFQKIKIEELKTAQNLLQQIYKYLIKPVVKDILSDIDKTEYTLKRMNIKLVLSHTDTTLRERTIISVANRQKIPSLVLQHGSAGHYWGFLPLIATKFAAWGESTKKWFIKNNVNEDRIDITGTANFDSYLQAIYSNKISGTTSWHGMKNFLLYVAVKGNKFQTGTKQTEQDNESLLGAILSAVETIPERILVIKLKSGDTQEEYYKSEIKRRELKNVFLVSATDNAKLLNACGVLITTCSTMGLEALIFRKPIIQLNFLNKHKLTKILYQQSIICVEGMPLAIDGAAIGIDSPDDLKKAIIDIYSNKNLRKLIIEKGKEFLKYNCSEPDGKASNRVLQQYDILLGKKAAGSIKRGTPMRWEFVG